MQVTKTALTRARYIASARIVQKTPPQQFFHCCLRIRCHGNVFTQSLPRNEPCNHVTFIYRCDIFRHVNSIHFKGHEPQTGLETKTH
jgi:hypothetical protein